MKSKLATALVGITASTLAGAATDIVNFPPTGTPFGYIAPLGINQFNISDGNGVIFRPWFHSTDFYGDLKANTIDASGAINSTAAWSLHSKFTSAATASATWWQSRKVAKSNGSSAASYICTADNASAYICGDRSNEGATASDYRGRGGILGDIVHSRPTYVGVPKAGYTINNYPSGISTTRAGQVYVGANDGMLHAINANPTSADYGKEAWAFIPNALNNGLSDLTPAGNDASHKYSVDGPITVADIYDSSTSSWKTLLVGGLGAGGRGFYALDVTDPAAANASAVAAKFLWEWDTSDSAHMGYSYGKPIIARVNNAGTPTWAVIIANGYDNFDNSTGSGDGKARLYVLNALTGALIGELAVGSAGSNGLSAPVALDANEDLTIDAVYAGDLAGTLWKFDFSNAASLSATALLKTTDSAGNSQAILAAPDIAKHPAQAGYMVYVGTSGLPTSSGMSSSATIQSVYGIRDHSGLASIINDTDEVTRRSTLLAQTLSAITGDWLGVTNNSIDWSSHEGWYIDLLNANQHIFASPLVRDKRLQLMIHDLTSGSEAGWLTQVNYKTGGGPSETIYDRTGDGLLSDADNPDYVNAGSPGTRAVGKKFSADLVSGNQVVRSGSLDYSLINTWSENNATSIGTSAPTPVCKMLYVDLRYTYSLDKVPSWKNPSNHDDGVDEDNGTNGSYDITFTGEVDEGGASPVSIDVKVANIQYRKGSKYNSATCNSTAGCTHGFGGLSDASEIDINLFAATDGAVFSSPSNKRGNGGSGATAYDGLSFDFSGTDLHRSNRSFDFAIRFESIYALKNFAFDFDFHKPAGANVVENSVERVEAEMVNCNNYGSSGASDDDARVIKDGVIEDDISEAGIYWNNATQKLTLTNRTGLTFETEATGGGGGGGGGGTPPTDGSPEATTTSGPDQQTGRLRWRELLF